MMCAASGAKDVTNFVVSLSEYGAPLPQPSSITHEGIYYEHYFDVGSEDEALFSCDWSFAASKDPISGKLEHYVGCGMRGKLDGDGIMKYGRLPVKLVIVLDISGSMASSFSRHEDKTKLQVAKDCVIALLDNLRATDSFSLIAFDTVADVVQPLSLVSSINLTELKEKVTELHPRGGTDMERGFLGAIAQYNPVKPKQSFFSNLGLFQPSTKEKQTHMNRIMFLTDAQPNAGATRSDQLLGISKEYAENHKIFTTFVGLGVDFGVKLVDAISHIKGCNYFTVMSAPEFKKLMEQDFDYVVTPCCFDVEVKLDTSVSGALSVTRVYGSPGNEIPQQGRLLAMTSGFPSAKDDSGLTKGGIILAKIEPHKSLTGKKTINLIVTYKDVDEQTYETRNQIEIDFGSQEEHYSSTAIRKAVVLTRFVNTMKWWIHDHRVDKDQTPATSVSAEKGIPPPPVPNSDSNDRGYFHMRVSDHYRDILRKLLDYMEREVEKLADSGDADDHLSDHTKHIVDLINFISAVEVERVLSKLCTNEEVEEGLNAEELRTRCEKELQVTSDLTKFNNAFETEIKRRLKEVLVNRIKAQDKTELKAALEGPDKEKQKALEELVLFITNRPDQEKEEWKRIANSEAYRAVHGKYPTAPRRFFVM